MASLVSYLGAWAAGAVTANLAAVVEWRVSRSSFMSDDSDRVHAAMTGGAAPHELAALAEFVDEELLIELVERLHELAPDRAAARRYAAALGALATGLPPVEHDAVADEVDLLLGAMAADDGLWPEATLRLQAVLRRTDEQADPETTASCEQMLGVVANEQGRHPEAIAHWDHARLLYLGMQQWFDAARAAASIASASAAAGLPDPIVRDRWAEAADLFERAGVRDDARQCGINASVLAIREIRGARDGAPGPLMRSAEAARDFAVRHRAELEAADLAAMIAVYASDVGEPWKVVQAWSAVAREEFRALDHDPLEVAQRLAWVDLVEGNAAIIAGRPVDAEPPIAAALQAFTRQGDVDRTRMCRRQLLSIMVNAERDLERSTPLFAAQDWPDPESAAVARYVEALAAERRGDVAQASMLVAQARALMMQAGEPIKAMVLDLAHASWLVDRGETGPATRCLTEIERYLSTCPTDVPRAALRWLAMTASILRAGLAAHEERRGEAVHELAAVEGRLVDAGAGMLAAEIAVQRARLLLDAGDTAQALHVVLPAALALDAVRFTLADADRRRRWSTVAADGFAVAYHAAAARRDMRVLAELVEVVRGNTLPSPQDSVAIGLDAILAEAGRAVLAGEPDAATPGIGRPWTGARAVSGASRTALGLPALLRTPWGTVALAGPLDRARRYHDPVRTAVTVDWTVDSAPG